MLFLFCGKNSTISSLSIANVLSGPAYLLIMIQQWLVMIMNFVVMALCLILTSLAVNLRSNSGFTGASLVSLMAFGQNLAYTIVFYTQLETSV